MTATARHGCQECRGAATKSRWTVGCESRRAHQPAEPHASPMAVAAVAAVEEVKVEVRDGWRVVTEALSEVGAAAESCW